MKNKKLITVAAVAGLAFGGLSVAAVASAQDYDSESPAAQIIIESDTSGLDGLMLVQDADESDRDGTSDDSRKRRGCDLDEAAEAIGISEDELQTALDSGATIAEVAEANGVDRAVVIDAMVDAKAERIEAKVAEGRITQEEADAKLAQTESRITDRVTGTESGGQI